MNNTKKANKITVFVGLMLLCLALFVCFFFKQFDFNLNTPIQNWIDTAVYFNNILSPLFLFMTVFLLYYTWRDTKNGLELQRKDTLYHSIINTLAQATGKFTLKIEQPLFKDASFQNDTIISQAMTLLGGCYLDYCKRKDDSPDASIDFKNRVGILDVIRKSQTRPNVYVSVIFHLYGELSEDVHKKGFLLNVYEAFNLEILIALVLLKLRTKELLEDREVIAQINNELEFFEESNPYCSSAERSGK